MWSPHLLSLGLVVLALGTTGCNRDSHRRPTPPTQERSGQRANTADNESAGTAPRQETAELPKVVFLGDSISAGLHLPASEAFPALLETRMRGGDSAFSLLNAGVSGDTTAGGLRRADWVLKQAPDIVVIELGANDGLRGVDLETIEANLRAIVAKVTESGAAPLLLGMRLPPSYGHRYADGFAAIYPRIAEELSVPLVPFFMREVAGVPEMNLKDGLHPTAEGHQRLAEAVAPALAEAIKGLQRN